MTMTKLIECQICGEGHLHPKEKRSLVEYNGYRGRVPVVFSVCDACNSEQADSAQLRDNKRAIIAFKKAMDGLLSGAEVRVIREHLELNQAEAAMIFGGGPVAFSKYESDDVAQSLAMDKLLRIAAEFPLAFNSLREISGLEQPVIYSSTWTTMEPLTAVQVKASSSAKPKQKIVNDRRLVEFDKLDYAA